MMLPVKVYKFGGASVKEAVAFARVMKIIQSQGHNPLVVVLSAMGKTTNALEALVRFVSRGEDYRDQLNDISCFHEDLSNQLQLSDNQDFTYGFLAILKELEGYCLSLTGQARALIYGCLVPIGERLSTIIMHHYLLKHGLKNILVDAREMILTDLNYEEGNVLWDETISRVQRRIKPILEQGHMVLTQGFIGAASNGHSVTLGREGSDYTAAILGSALNAESVTIWKDVPGVLNADPKEIQDAKPFQYLPYSEAMELSYFGAKVIHPKTIKPLRDKDIPLYVRSFDHPSADGTLIHGEGEIIPPYSSIIYKHGQLLVSLIPRDASFIDEAALGHIFNCFTAHGIRIDLMQNSALSFSFCTPNSEGLTDKLISVFSKEFQVRYNENTSLLTIRHHSSSIIETYTKGKKILLEQQTRHTYQAVVL